MTSTSTSTSTFHAPPPPSSPSSALMPPPPPLTRGANASASANITPLKSPFKKLLLRDRRRKAKAKNAAAKLYLPGATTDKQDNSHLGSGLGTAGERLLRAISPRIARRRPPHRGGLSQPRTPQQPPNTPSTPTFVSFDSVDGSMFVEDDEEEEGTVGGVFFRFGAPAATSTLVRASPLRASSSSHKPRHPSMSERVSRLRRSASLRRTSAAAEAGAFFGAAGARRNSVATPAAAAAAHGGGAARVSRVLYRVGWAFLTHCLVRYTVYRAYIVLYKST